MDIKDLIENEICPIVDSIICQNGKLYVLQNYIKGSKHYIRILCKSTIESYFEFNSIDDVCSFDILCTDETEKYKVYAGEGSYGSEGIIYLFDKEHNQYAWLLHLNESNPFVTVNVYDDKILALNNNGEQWIIPVCPILSSQ